MATRFVPNPGFIPAYKVSAAYLALMHAKAAEAAIAARGLAPRHTGDYADSIQADGTRILTTHPAGHIVEWGSVNNEPYAPLRKGAEAVGARVVDTGPGDG